MSEDHTTAERPRELTKPRPSAWTSPRIENTFVYHPPSGILDEEEQDRTREAYEQIRAAGGLFACVIGAYSQPTAEEARAVNSIQEAVMLANASIATAGVAMGVNKDGMDKALLLSEFADTLCLHFNDPNTPKLHEMSKVSDGYHTFDELYEHRNALFIALMASSPDNLPWISHVHADLSPMFDGFFIAGMTLLSGDVTYHLPIEYWDDCVAANANVLDVAKDWDGHTAPDVVTRLQRQVTGEGCVVFIDTDVKDR